MRKAIPLQLSLFRNLALGPVLLGLTLFALSLFTTRQLLEKFSVELTSRTIAETETAFVEFLRPVQEIVELSHKIGQEGRFQANTPEELDPVFAAMLETVPQVTSVHLAKASGDSYMLLRNPDGSFYNRLYSPDQPGVITTREWSTRPAPGLVRLSENVPSDYDPRQRSWFRDALAEHTAAENAGTTARPVWSDPYTFFTTKDPGITTSVAYHTPAGETEVLAFDILLSDILEFARQREVGKSGLVFVLLRHPQRDDLEVLAMPSDKLTGSQSLKATDFPVPASRLSGAPGAFMESAFPAGVPREIQARPFRAAGATWWGASALSPLSDDREVWIVAMLPESEVLAGIPDTSLITLVVLLVTVVLMVLRARRLARRYGDPIGELVAQTERMSRLNFTRETTIESPLHEVQALASSQDAMRRSLSALSAMNDREAIAQELRALPDSMKGVRGENWEVAMWDRPAAAGGGEIPVLLPAALDDDGSWLLGSGDPPRGAALLLASTHLTGMRAARSAAAVRATARAVLRRSTRPEPLLRAVREELIEGASATGPVSLSGAFFNAATRTVEIAHERSAGILHWKAASRSVHSLSAPSPSPANEIETCTLTLDAGDRLLLVSGRLFDLLDQDRRRLPLSSLEALLAQFADESAPSLSNKLGASIEAFRGDSLNGMDLVLFVIAASSPASRSGPSS